MEELKVALRACWRPTMGEFVSQGSLLLLEGKPYWDGKFLMRTLAFDPAIELRSVIRLTDERLMERTLRRVDSDSPAIETGAPASTQSSDKEEKIARSEAEQHTVSVFLARRLQHIIDCATDRYGRQRPGFQCVAFRFCLLTCKTVEPALSGGHKKLAVGGEHTRYFAVDFCFP